ncbi:MAG: hypothetical protein CMQ34_11895 [Gammaproteobacteria bacterium]|nr:hypothetical protein [Gammaproteobacteria bacterium]|tara:strand:- start:3942 stop:4253 length:312 start_codon:yes stop_codon:yes gene_type:complete
MSLIRFHVKQGRHLAGARPWRSLAWLAAVALTGCVAPGEGNFIRPPTPAEVEQYNAMVQPEERIVCRTEIPIGSNIPVRKCRLAVDIDETSVFHREQLRRALR